MTTAVKVEVGKAQGFKIQFDQTACQFNALDQNDNVVASAGSKAYLVRKLKKKQLNIMTYEKLKGFELWCQDYEGGYIMNYTLTGVAKVTKSRYYRSREQHQLQATDKAGKTFWIDNFYRYFESDEKLFHELKVATEEATKANSRLRILQKKLKRTTLRIKKLAPGIKIFD